MTYRDMSDASGFRLASNFLRRHRFVIFFGIVIYVVGRMVVHRFFKTEIDATRDDYNDDVIPEVFDGVIKRWYNFTDVKWHNKNDISMFDDVLITEMRNNWIINGTDDNSTSSYVLRQPEVWDPSMGQARAIMNILGNKTNGFFIESGAYDGETRSNTLVLERFFGWTGILIEPDPINFTKMLGKNRRAKMSPSCLSIEPHPMNVSFLLARNIGRIDEKTNSTMSHEKNTPDVAHTGRHIDVQCFPIASYIAAVGVKTVDYFSLDVEGSEMRVLRTVPFERVDIRTLSVEYRHVDEGRDGIINFMKQKGYRVHSFVTHPDNLANDVIFVKTTD